MIKKGRFAKLLIFFSTVGLLLLVFYGNLVVFAENHDQERLPVGGDVYPVSMLDIVAPWLGMAALMAVAIAVVLFVKRRRVA